MSKSKLTPRPNITFGLYKGKSMATARHAKRDEMAMDLLRKGYPTDVVAAKVAAKFPPGIREVHLRRLFIFDPKPAAAKSTPKASAKKTVTSKNAPKGTAAKPAVKRVRKPAPVAVPLTESGISTGASAAIERVNREYAESRITSASPIAVESTETATA